MSCCDFKTKTPVESDSCCHGGGGPDRSENGENRSDSWLRLGISLVVAGQGMVWGLAINLDPPAPGSPSYLLLHGWLILSTLLVLSLLAPPLVRDALARAKQGKWTTEALFILTAFGAFAGSLISTFTGRGAVYYEVVAIVLCVYSVGRSLANRSRSQTLQAVGEFEERYQRATRLTCCGKREEVPLEALSPGDRVWVAAGDPFTVDGTILGGTGSILESAMTGEPGTVTRRPGQAVYAGTWSVDAGFEVEVTSASGERRLDQILRIIREAPDEPSTLQKPADRIAQIFFPFVAITSLATFVGWVRVVPWPEALFNSMAVLLVACPCALGLATPLAVWSGLWNLSRMGLVVRSAGFLDVLARSRVLFFDKTGTLSPYHLEVSRFIMKPEREGEREALLPAVARLEADFQHPLADAVCRWIQQNEPAAAEVSRTLPLLESQLVPGRGVRGRLALPRVQSVGFGGDDPETGVDPAPCDLFIGHLDTIPDWANDHRCDATEPVSNRFIGIIIQGEAVGFFELREHLSDAVPGLFQSLRELQVPAQILTGDPQPAWDQIEGVPVQAGLSPEDKVEAVRKSRKSGDLPILVGDGINDAAAMAESSGSIVVETGSRLTLATGSAVLIGNHLDRIPRAIHLARKIRQRLGSNLVFAAGYNLIGMGLAAAGMLHPVVAALLMVGSSAFVSSRAALSAQETLP